MEFVLHDRVSEFLKSTALSPPQRPGDGFDLLDVVVVDPHAKDPSKMLVPTDTDLRDFSKTRVHRRDKSRVSYPSTEQRRSDEVFELNEELKSAIGFKGVNVSQHGSHSTSTHVNLVISHEKTHAVSGTILPQLESMVKESFGSIVKNAARYNIKKNRGWYNYYAGGRDVYFLAVITKVYYGKISIEESDSSNRAAGVKAKVTGVWKAFTEGQRSESNSLTSSSEGIVGVQLLCFPFKKGEEEGTYSVIDPISIKWMDKNDRKRLHRVSKRHSWSPLDSGSGQQMSLSSSFASACRESITSYASTTVTYAQKVKSYDFRPLKLLAMFFIAALFLVQIIASISSNTNLVDMSSELIPRYSYILRQALEDFIKHSVRALT